MFFKTTLKLDDDQRHWCIPVLAQSAMASQTPIVDPRYAQQHGAVAEEHDGFPPPHPPVYAHEPSTHLNPLLGSQAV